MLALRAKIINIYLCRGIDIHQRPSKPQHWPHPLFLKLERPLRGKAVCGQNVFMRRACSKAANFAPVLAL